MMIKLFFNRFSKIAYLTEAIGVVLMAVASFKVFTRDGGGAVQVLSIATVVQYIFIRFCATFRWHRDVPRYSGLELHFKKVMVATAYVIALFWLIFLVVPSVWPLIVANLILLFISHINVILLYFYFHDKNRLPVNYYSSGRFLEDSNKIDAKDDALKNLQNHN